MGVPAFYTWLIQKYPDIAMKLLNNGHKFNCDYFYLDMNGIIHPCCHPEGTLKPKNEDEMIEFMCTYLDMLLDYINVSKCLFIAIDGPPPRAKIIQQRERRFIKDYEMNINKVSNDDNNESEWDSNQITPGTLFMIKVANKLTQYIKNKLKNNKNISIILSDASVPGEGEHKILDFIRNLRYCGSYNSNDSHLLFSNDADMILLSLLLHESNCYLMRDIPMRMKLRKASSLFQTKFNIISINQIIKYIFSDLSCNKLKYKSIEYDINRVIDDYVFLTYFVGNDFIPCLPFMNMRDNAFEYLLQKYCECSINLTEYLVNGSNINYNSLNTFLNTLANEEKDILLYRSHCFLERTDDNKLQYNYRNKKRKSGSDFNGVGSGVATKKRKLNNGTQNNINIKKIEENVLNIDALNKKCRSDLKYINFGAKGYNIRYYKRKFNDKLMNKNLNEFKNEIKCEYIRGLSWIQSYYYTGCISWNWFYSFNYSPLVNDIIPINNSNINNKLLWNKQLKGKPLKPLIQLSVVMPKNSAKITIPTEYFNVIFNKNSKYLRYYPNKFKMDLNFKQLNWESIAIIPHIDVDALNNELNNINLNDKWMKLNKFGKHKLFVNKINKNQLFQDKILNQWGLKLIDNDNDDDDDIEVVKYEFEMNSVLDLANDHRKCMDDDDDNKDKDDDVSFKSRDINLNNLDIVSSTMCKYFMAGKCAPNQIVKFVSKRPDILKKSLKKLRRATKYKRNNTKKNKKQKIFRKKIFNKNKKKEKKQQNNNNLINKLKSIGIKQSMNTENASKLIIDSFLNAINNKNKNKNNNNYDNNNNKKNEIKMKITKSKIFQKKQFKQSTSIKRDDINNKQKTIKLSKRKRKREKLKQKLKNNEKNINIHSNKLDNNQSIQQKERNLQVNEVEKFLNQQTNKKSKKKKKKKKKKKNKLSNTN